MVNMMKLKPYIALKKITLNPAVQLEKELNCILTLGLTSQ